jgi:hypothetical protein
VEKYRQSSQSILSSLTSPPLSPSSNSDPLREPFPVLITSAGQSDFTHPTLADGTEVEILNWLDDHSRYLLTCTAYDRVTGPDVVASFTDTANTYGLPAST